MTGLPDNVRLLRDKLRACDLCPRACGVDRLAGQRGACRTGADAMVASAAPHFGEEPVLVAGRGSGTIFLAGCNLHCAFCQNHDISQHAVGEPMLPAQLAEIALALQRRGCANVNFVSPTHVAHAVAEAVVLARGAGLTVPVVWNSNGYESGETLRLLAGLVDIYMPDFKYADAAAGEKYSGVADYPAVAMAAVAEMYEQVGPLAIGPDGAARRGVLVRHLVMPYDPARARWVIEIVATLAPRAGINVMGQYRPSHRAREFPELCGHVPHATVVDLRQGAAAKGLVRVDH